MFDQIKVVKEKLKTLGDQKIRLETERLLLDSEKEELRAELEKLNMTFAELVAKVNVLRSSLQQDLDALNSANGSKPH